MNETLYTALALVPALVIAIVCHEVAHGWVARALGDPTASNLGRLTLNPIRHVDPVGTLLIPGLLALSSGPIFGWAKPVPVNKWKLRNPRFGMVAVAAAGPLMNIVLAVLGAILLGLTGGDSAAMQFIGIALSYFILINVFLALFNLLPIPPFDGSHIVEGLLPEKAAAAYAKLRPFGMVLFFVLVATVWLAPDLHVLENTIGPPVRWVLDQLESVVRLVSGE